MTGHETSGLMREEDIRPAALMRDKKEYLEWDRQFLLSRKDRWTTIACPACDVAASRTFGEKAGFAYVECVQCGTVYTNPRPSQELVHEFYAQSRNYEFWNRHVFPATEDARRQSIIRPRAERLLAYCRQLEIAHGALLEIGAAFGTFCEEVRASNYFARVIAVEPTPYLAASCRKRGIETIETSVELIGESAIADAVVAFEVLEHLYSPRAFIEQCTRLLRPTGILVLSCPNVRGFDVATLRLLSDTFDHEHLNYFHPESLSALLQKCGLEIVDVFTPGKLDVELARKHALAGRLDLRQQPFLHRMLVEEGDPARDRFQSFLAENRLSSHMWAIAKLATR